MGSNENYRKFIGPWLTSRRRGLNRSHGNQVSPETVRCGLIASLSLSSLFFRAPRLVYDSNIG